MPFPQTMGMGIKVQTEGKEAEQFHPFSTTQLELQPSPLAKLPSSQAYPASPTAFPHWVQMDGKN